MLFSFVKSVFYANVCTVICNNRLLQKINCYLGFASWVIPNVISVPTNDPIKQAKINLTLKWIVPSLTIHIESEIVSIIMRYVFKKCFIRLLFMLILLRLQSTQNWYIKLKTWFMNCLVSVVFYLVPKYHKKGMSQFSINQSLSEVAEIIHNDGFLISIAPGLAIVVV